MIKIIDGDLLTSNTDIIAHQVIAKVLLILVLQKRSVIMMCKYIKIIIVFVRLIHLNNYWVLLDIFSLILTQEYMQIYLHQKSYGYDGKQYTDINSLRKCFENLRSYAVLENMSIAMPYKIGCVRGGANWEEVYQMINDIFENCNIELWRLDKG